jgi:hypothetical protein
VALAALAIDLRDLAGTGPACDAEILLQWTQVRPRVRLAIRLQNQPDGFPQADTPGFEPRRHLQGGRWHGKGEQQSKVQGAGPAPAWPLVINAAGTNREEASHIRRQGGWCLASMLGDPGLIGKQYVAISQVAPTPDCPALWRRS